MKFLIDTNIIIDHLRIRDESILTFLKRIENGEIKASISVITEFELLASSKISESQMKIISQLLNLLPRISVTPSIARRAAFLKRTYNIDLADNLIAATAWSTKSTLLTRNIKHFKKIKEIKIQAV